MLDKSDKTLLDSDLLDHILKITTNLKHNSSCFEIVKLLHQNSVNLIQVAANHDGDDILQMFEEQRLRQSLVSGFENSVDIFSQI